MYYKLLHIKKAISWRSIFFNTLEFLKIFSGHFFLTQADVIKDHCT